MFAVGSFYDVNVCEPHLPRNSKAAHGEGKKGSVGGTDLSPYFLCFLASDETKQHLPCMRSAYNAEEDRRKRAFEVASEI